MLLHPKVRVKVKVNVAYDYCLPLYSSPSLSFISIYTNMDPKSPYYIPFSNLDVWCTWKETNKADVEIIISVDVSRTELADQGSSNRLKEP